MRAVERGHSSGKNGLRRGEKRKETEDHLEMLS